MNLDEPLLGAAQVAELAQTDIVNIHTWTTHAGSPIPITVAAESAGEVGGCDPTQSETPCDSS